MCVLFIYCMYVCWVILKVLIFHAPVTHYSSSEDVSSFCSNSNQTEFSRPVMYFRRRGLGISQDLILHKSRMMVVVVVVAISE